MDKKEAQLKLGEVLRTYRAREYSDLRDLIGSPNTFEVKGVSGVRYQLEVQAFWDDKPDNNIRIMVSIDDGGLRAFYPITEDFIMSPSGAFVGE